MDHAIEGLVSQMNAAIEMNRGYVSKEDVKAEIQAYVNAINCLEVYYYGKKKTTLEAVLAYY